jgi:hypothetical protein
VVGCTRLEVIEKVTHPSTILPLDNLTHNSIGIKVKMLGLSHPKDHLSIVSPVTLQVVKVKAQV